MDKNRTPYRSDLFQRLATEWYLKGLQEGQQERWKEGWKEGWREGMKKALFSVLSARRLVISPKQREHIAACTNEGQLHAWVERAVTAASVEEVLGGGGGGGLPG